jgi:putative colanic acid biosynthesis glycosyltransferase
MGDASLTVVTVVFQDWPGLAETVSSAAALRREGVEHWVIDGSRDGSVTAHADELAATGVHLLSEPDAGIYDAMNKGLDRATGDYVVFMNAGDTFDSGFSLEGWQAQAAQFPGRLLLGYSVERWEQDAYLRPGLGRESRALQMPAHPATFYPREFYATNRYTLDRPIGADGAYTGLAARLVGAAFIPILVCQFELGGRSSSYDRSALRYRYSEYKSARARLKITTKAVLWRVLPRASFYRTLARGKYTRLGDAPARLRESSLPLTSRPVAAPV